MLFTAAALSCGCGSTSEPSSECPNSSGVPYQGEYMFERCTSLTVTASKSEFEVGEELKITFECNPIYTGTGVVQAQFLGGGSIKVDVPPVRRELEKYDFFAARAEFTANERFSMTWIIRAFAERDHHLYAYARFDSVVLGDSLVALRSDPATAAYGFLSPKPARNSPAFVLRWSDGQSN